MDVPTILNRWRGFASKSVTLAAAALTGAFVIASAPASASAEEAPEAIYLEDTTSEVVIEVDGLEAATAVTYSEDPLCLELRERDGTDGPCLQQNKVQISEATPATAEQLEAHGDLIAADGTRLSDIGAQATIYTRTWDQEYHGFYYYNWIERHKGRTYFDYNGHVWSTSERSGYTGYHTCGLGSGFGYSIVVTDCFTENRSDLSKPAISEWDYFQVHVVASGVPIYASHNQHCNHYHDGDVLCYH